MANYHLWASGEFDTRICKLTLLITEPCSQDWSKVTRYRSPGGAFPSTPQGAVSWAAKRAVW